MSKVLVIIKSMGIGDLCILISNVHAISKKMGCPVTVMAQKNTRANAILKHDPHVEEVIELNEKGFFNIVKKIKSKIQIGGGIRTIDDISRWIEIGIDRVVMGTAAVENLELLEMACNKFKNKIAVSLDAKDGLIALSGWKKQTNISAIDLIKKIQNFGVSRIIYTDINRDGTKQGPNIKDTVELSTKAKIPLVISGGVSSLEDIKKIKSLRNSNIEGVIIGKAIYDGDIKINDLAKLI